MLINHFKPKRMPFLKLVKLRILLGSIVVAVGIFALFLSISSDVFPDEHTNSWLQGFQLGTGCGLIGAGVALVIRHIYLLRNSEARAAAEVKQYDERTVYMQGRAAQYTFYICFFALYLFTLLFSVINPTVTTTLLYVITGIAIVYIISLFVIKAKV